jgi:hypothetical protein
LAGRALGFSEGGQAAAGDIYDHAYRLADATAKLLPHTSCHAFFIAAVAQMPCDYFEYALRELCGGDQRCINNARSVAKELNAEEYQLFDVCMLGYRGYEDVPFFEAPRGDASLGMTLLGIIELALKLWRLPTWAYYFKAEPKPYVQFTEWLRGALEKIERIPCCGAPPCGVSVSQSGYVDLIGEYKHVSNLFRMLAPYMLLRLVKVRREGDKLVIEIRDGFRSLVCRT